MSAGDLRWNDSIPGLMSSPELWKKAATNL